MSYYFNCNEILGLTRKHLSAFSTHYIKCFESMDVLCIFMNDVSLFSVDAMGVAPVAQEFLKKGSPTAFRAKLWQHILGSHLCKEVIAFHYSLFVRKRRRVIRTSVSFLQQIFLSFHGMKKALFSD